MSRKCLEECKKTSTSCQEKECRQWIDYDEDLNCCLHAIDKHGPMSLKEIAKRLKVSSVRIFQIEKEILERISEK